MLFTAESESLVGIEPADNWTGQMHVPIVLAATTGRGRFIAAISRRPVRSGKWLIVIAVIPPVGTGTIKGIPQPRQARSRPEGEELVTIVEVTPPDEEEEQAG